MTDHTTPGSEIGGPFRVLIAGGGIAGMEAAFALHELAGNRIVVTVLADAEQFVMRPQAVGEPFNRGRAEHHPLEQMVTAAGARLASGTLAEVDAERRTVRTAEGAELAYDALLVATGAAAQPAYEHATNFDDARADELLHGLVQDVEEGYVQRLAVVIPAPMPWPLPGYELALMASERAWDMQAELDITLLTPERMPLEVFGRQVSRAVSGLLAERRIEVITSAYCEIPRSQEIVVHPGGRHVHAQRIIALPRLRGPAITGLPYDGGGFVPVDEFGRVPDVAGVWAAGDATDEPIKQGGVAAQLADVAARSIAAAAGLEVEHRPFAPTLEGVLMTGGSPRFLSARPAWPGEAGESIFAQVPQSLAPPKVAAHYLGAYLKRTSSSVGATA